MDVICVCPLATHPEVSVETVALAAAEDGCLRIPCSPPGTTAMEALRCFLARSFLALGLSVDETLSSLVSPNSTRRLRAAPGGVEAAVGGVPWGDSSVVVSGQGTVLPKIQIHYKPFIKSPLIMLNLLQSHYIRAPRVT